MTKLERVIPFPAKNVSNIATFFLKQKVREIASGQDDMEGLQAATSSASMNPTAQSHLGEIMLINERQQERIGKLLLRLERLGAPTSPAQEYYRVVNEDFVETDSLVGFTQLQSRLVCSYEDALQFAYALDEDAIHALLTDALADAKRADALLKQVSLGMVIRPRYDSLFHKAVMT